MTSYNNDSPSYQYHITILSSNYRGRLPLTVLNANGDALSSAAVVKQNENVCDNPYSNFALLLELVFIRSGCLKFSDMSNGMCISACKINAFIQFLCTS